MKKRSLLLCSLLVSLIVAVACNHSNQEESLKEMVTIEEAKVIIAENKGNENFVLLDVRTNAEFKEGYLEGHLEDPDVSEEDPYKKQKGVLQYDYYDKDFASWILGLDKAKRYLVYCRTQNRAKKAFDILKDKGFKKIQYMYGGYTAWSKANRTDSSYGIVKLPYEKAVDVLITGDKIKTNSTIKFDFLATNLDGDPARHAKLSLKILSPSDVEIATQELKAGDDGKVSHIFDLTGKSQGKYKLVCNATHKDSEGGDYKPVEALYYFEVAAQDEVVSGSATEIQVDPKDIKGIARAKKFYNRNIYGYQVRNRENKVVTLEKSVDSSKPTLVLFFSTKCQGCMKKSQELIKYKLDNINLIPIITSLDLTKLETEIAKTEKDLKDEYGLGSIINITLYDAENGIWGSRFKFGETPQFVLINKEGQVKNIMDGDVTIKAILDEMQTKFNLPAFELK